MKLVSILMPIHNCETYLEEALQSILRQTHTNFELLLVNDASTDRSEEIVKSFVDSRIRYFVNPTKKGIVATLNATLQLCKGTFIARMDGDDIAHSERIEKQANFLSANAAVGLVGSWYITRDTVNDQTKIVRRHLGDPAIRFHMLFRNQFLHPGIMMRATIFKDLRYHDVSTCEDYDLWARALARCQVANYPEILMVYRWHGKNISIVNQSAMRKSIMYIVSNLLTTYDIDHSADELLLQTMIALGFNKDQVAYLGKLGKLKEWLDKLAESEILNTRFGTSFVEREIMEYKQMYGFT